MRRILVAILAFAQFASAWGQTSGNACSAGSGYVVAYFNGIKNTFSEASSSKTTIKLVYGNTFGNEQLAYQLFYNPTEGFLRDVAETFKQKEAETPAFKDRWDLLWELIDGGTEIVSAALLGDPSLAAPVQLLRSIIVEKMRDSANAMIASSTPNVVVSDFAVQMQTLFTERKKVVAVAHSQGNLFLNAMYDIVHPTLATDSLRTVHVAAASTSVRGPYVTADIDTVIQALRGILGSTLPTSTPNPEIPSLALVKDPYGHSFPDTYMHRAYGGLPIIKGHIDVALQAVQAPALNGSSGLFTVTLTWDGPGDVDLHIFEPNQGHVFFASKVGFSGDLDVDNVVANGPEHYVASCSLSRLQEGLYTVGVNNFSGAAGRIATLQLTTLSTVHLPVKIPLVAGIGSTTSPVLAFKVRVIRSTASGAIVVTKE